MTKKIICSILFIMIVPITVSAHNSHYEEISSSVRGVKVSYDSGDPITKAKVLIYAPGETEVWKEKITDSEGIVTFIPTKQGTWILQVRGEGGHGLRINLEVGKNNGTDEQTPGRGITMGQKIGGSLLMLWGCLGTVLYFKGRKK